MLQYLIDVNVDVKTVIIPAIIFYIMDLVVIHEQNNIPSGIPFITDLLQFIYRYFGNFIFNNLHSQVMSHTLVFIILLIFCYNLVENFNFLYLKNKSKEILF